MESAASIFSQATSVGAGVFETVTCSFSAGVSEVNFDANDVIPSAIAGTAVTIITSEGGEAITLATSGAGKVTSFAGSEYTVATAAAESAASGLHSGAVEPFDFGVLGVMLMSVTGGALFGAWMTL
jgi:hypothetical protein